MIEQAIILAAGFGSRMRPLTDAVPKPLLRINKRPIIEYIIQSLVAANVKKIIIHVSYLANQIIEEIGSGSKYQLNNDDNFKLEIEYSFSSEPLESGGGIMYSMPYLEDHNKPFICVNADIFTDYDFISLTKNNSESLLEISELMGHLVMVPNPNQNRKGDFDIINNRIVKDTGVSKHHDYTYSGIAVYNSILLQKYFDSRQSNNLANKFSIKECYLKYPNLFSASVYKGSWHDIGTIERYNYLNKQYEIN